MSIEKGNKIDTIGKQPTGIAGLDDLLGGGIPDRRVTLIQGGPGTGKTVLAMEAMVNHVNNGGHAVVVAFEEQPDELLENLRGFDWGRATARADRFHVIDARLDDFHVTRGQFDINGLLASIESRLRGKEQAWVLLDGLDLLLRILEDGHRQRQELYRLKRWIRDQGITGLLTAKEERDSREWSGGFLQYTADCVIQLRSMVLDRVFKRTLRVVKYRGSRCVGSEFPFIIGPRGVEVPYRSTTELRHAVSPERVGTGVPRLDTLVGGGYRRGTSILISGAPGTAKTTLGSAFLQAAAERGEKSLFVSFDESAEQILLNTGSVGIRLDRARDEGLLRILSFRAGNTSAEEHFSRILEEIDEHEPRSLVIDPISALLKSGGRVVADTVAERLLDYSKARGITSIFTSLLRMESQNGEDTESQISTLADTWINLTYANFEGERNRALSIVKSRGSAHSNQMRELIITSEGIVLADVYSAGGAVLMGTARLEKEADNRARAAQRAMEYRIERERIKAEIEDSQVRLQEMERELAHRRRNLELLDQEHENRRERVDSEESRIRRSRRADTTGPGRGEQ